MLKTPPSVLNVGKLSVCLLDETFTEGSFGIDGHVV